MALAGCGPETPTRAASDNVVAGVVDEGAAWPLLLQHCLRSVACDPASDFGTGAGEASNAVGSVAWFAQSKARVTEGAEDYGAKAEINLFGQRAVGGKAGRPLTLDELPDNLGGAKAKRATLSLEYRAPSGALEPYFLQFVSPHLAGLAEGIDEAVLEVKGSSGLLFSATAGAMDVPETPVNGNSRPPKAVTFFVSRNLRDEPLPQLLEAIAKGDTLSVRLVSQGETVMVDALYTDGFGVALEQAGAAVNDPEIARPVVERCAAFAGKPDAFWKIADVTPAFLVCDPRLAEQRR
jgi:hypothetical protein